jgi:hypothetical protein
MTVSPLLLGEALANRCSQVLYRCLQEVGSTKGALYLRLPGQRAFDLISFFGWPRGTRPPVQLPDDHPLLVRASRERRPFVVNDASDAPELSAFGQGTDWPRYLISPVYSRGDWVGLLVQRDRIKGGTFDRDRDEPPTLAICEDLAQAVQEFPPFGTGARPLPATDASSVPEDLPTATDILESVAPPPERLLPPVPDASVEPLHAAAPRIRPSGPGPHEEMYGFQGGSEA